MINSVTKVNFEDIPQFSNKDIFYQNGHEAYEGFFKYPAELSAFRDIIEARSKAFPVDRALLVDVLHEQYSSHVNEKVQQNIKLLQDTKTFTVTTAHQPVLLLGPLYMVYKILSTVHLSSILKKEYPQYNFVPIFVSGAEDHDLEEVATLHLFGKDYTWHTDQTGPVGRMDLTGLRASLDEVISVFGNSEYAEELKNLINDAYQGATSYGGFNINLYKTLFSDLGVVIVNMDSPRLKEKLLPYAIKEIKDRTSHHIVRETQEKLTKRGIKEQAHVRDINLFLMTQGKRDRIVVENEKYTVGDTSYTESELIDYITEHPDCISPNVVMRPIYQELILPNLAYIGGGGELAYWLERRSQFEAFNVSYPILIRRNSALLLNKSGKKNIDKIGLSPIDFFSSTDELSKLFLSKNIEETISLQNETNAIADIFKSISEKAKAIDPNLEKYVLAESAKQSKVINNIQGKMTKAAKQKNETQLKKLHNIKGKLFPDGKLQERYDSFIPFYLKNGKSWFKELLEVLNPLEKEFLIIEE